jgi:hypothetical protein
MDGEMKLTRRSLLRIPAAMPLLSVAQDGAGASEKPFGIWCGHPRDAAALKQQAPFVKGSFATMKWSDLEPANNQFDWKMFESSLASQIAFSRLYAI